MLIIFWGSPDISSCHLVGSVEVVLIRKHHVRKPSMLICLLVPNVIGLSPSSSNSSQIKFATEKIETWRSQECKRCLKPNITTACKSNEENLQYHSDLFKFVYSECKVKIGQLKSTEDWRTQQNNKDLVAEFTQVRCKPKIYTPWNFRFHNQLHWKKVVKTCFSSVNGLTWKRFWNKYLAILPLLRYYFHAVIDRWWTQI